MTRPYCRNFCELLQEGLGGVQGDVRMRQGHSRVEIHTLSHLNSLIGFWLIVDKVLTFQSTKTLRVLKLVFTIGPSYED